MSMFKQAFICSFILLITANFAIAAELDAMIYVSGQKESYEPEKIQREFVYGETAYHAIFAEGFTRDDFGRANLTADVTFIAPDGKVLFEKENFTGLDDVLPADVELAPLKDGFDVMVNEGDPVGMYTVEADVRDLNAGNSAATQTTLLIFDTEVSRKLIMTPVVSIEHLDGLWAEYFRSRHPWAVKRIISALKYSGEESVDKVLIGKSAQWSLEKNGRADTQVAELIRQAFSETGGVTHDVLGQIIDVINESRAMDVQGL